MYSHAVARVLLPVPFDPATGGRDRLACPHKLVYARRRRITRPFCEIFSKRGNSYSYILALEGHRREAKVLVLSRKRDEKILLKVNDEEKIELTVVRIDANKVRLGIQASDSVTILRSELLENPEDSPKVASTEVA
jgi:carbon storage regulator CsrA